MSEEKKKKVGRPPTRGVRKVTLAVRVTPACKEYLDQCIDSAGNVVENAVQQTDDFRKWEQRK